MACYFHMTSHYGSAQTSQEYIIRLQEFPTLRKKTTTPNKHNDMVSYKISERRKIFLGHLTLNSIKKLVND